MPDATRQPKIVFVHLYDARIHTLHRDSDLRFMPDIVRAGTSGGRNPACRHKQQRSTPRDREQFGYGMKMDHHGQMW